jgi:hypothetical protein
MRDTGKDPVRVMGVGCGVSVLVAVAEALFVFDGVLEGVAVGVGELEGVGEKESKHATAGSPNVPGGHAVPMRNVTLSIRRVPPPPEALNPRTRTASEVAPSARQGSAALARSHDMGTEAFWPNDS